MKIGIILLLFTLFGAPAQALIVSNCDDVEQTVTIDYYGEKLEVTLAPNRTRHFYGRARELSIGEQSIYLVHNNVEYCVRDGRLKLQRRLRSNHRRR